MGGGNTVLFTWQGFRRLKTALRGRWNWRRRRICKNSEYYNTKDDLIIFYNFCYGDYRFHADFYPILYHDGRRALQCKPFSIPCLCTGLLLNSLRWDIRRRCPGFYSWLSPCWTTIVFKNLGQMGYLWEWRSDYEEEKTEGKLFHSLLAAISIS